MTTRFSGRDEALAWLAGHVDYERTAPKRRSAPSLEPVRSALEALGRPQDELAFVHVTGTNGKGSATAICAALLTDTGRRVGVFTSPDLHAVNERIAVAGQPIDDEELTSLLARLCDLELAMGRSLTRFELLTVGALLHFADEAVDVCVVEVGLGGTWDATNVIDAGVAVVTNVSLDHTEVLGDTVAEIATDKAGIIGPGAIAVLGDDDPTTLELQSGLAIAAGAEQVWRRHRELEVARNDLAVGGRLVSLRTALGVHEDVFVSLHGAHQASNALCGVAAAEAHCGARLDDAVIGSTLGTIAIPGRLEVLEHEPLVLMDCAHNPAGAEVLGTSLRDEFEVEGSTRVVVGMLRGRDPLEFLSPLAAAGVTAAWCCRAPSPRALEPVVLASAASSLGMSVEVVDDVAHAMESALDASEPDDAVVVTGSFYVVGSARGHLLGLPPHVG